MRINGAKRNIYHIRKSQVSYVEEMEECYHIYMKGGFDSFNQRITIYKKCLSEEDTKAIKDLISYIDYQE